MSYILFKTIIELFLAAKLAYENRLCRCNMKYISMVNNIFDTNDDTIRIVYFSSDFH